jgi:hypothetical protein
VAGTLAAKEDDMKRFRAGVGRVGPFLVVLSLTSALPRVLAQSSTEPARAQKSVRGTLQTVDKSLNGLIMKSDSGKRMAWQFSSTVVAEVAKFPKGAPVIVIYRQISSNEKRVTAVAFPGTAEKPTYVNMTGERVLLRSAPAVGDACGPTEPPAPTTELVIPMGGRAEVLEACWCCAPIDGTCVPGNKSGAGQAFLAQCFQ